jgi:hypothetical protein
VKEFKPKSAEELQKWLKEPYDPNDPDLSYDHEQWLETSAKIAKRVELEQLARENAGTRVHRTTALIGSFAEEREHNPTPKDDHE